MILLSGNLINVSSKRTKFEAIALEGNILYALSQDVDDGRYYHIEVLNDSKCYPIREDDSEHGKVRMAHDIIKGELKPRTFDHSKMLKDCFLQIFNQIGWKDGVSIDYETTTKGFGPFKKEMKAEVRSKYRTWIWRPDMFIPKDEPRSTICSRIKDWATTHCSNKFEKQPQLMFDALTQDQAFMDDLNKLFDYHEVDIPMKINSSSSRADEIVDDIFSLQVEADKLEKTLLGLNRGKVKVKQLGLIYHYEGPTVEELLLESSETSTE